MKKNVVPFFWNPGSYGFRGIPGIPAGMHNVGWGESDYNGRDVVSGPSLGGVGWRMLIVAPHTAAAVDDDDDRRRGGGGVVPSPFQSVLSHRMPLVDIVDIADLG